MENTTTMWSNNVHHVECLQVTAGLALLSLSVYTTIFKPFPEIYDGYCTGEHIL